MRIAYVHFAEQFNADFSRAGVVCFMRRKNATRSACGPGPGPRGRGRRASRGSEGRGSGWDGKIMIYISGLLRARCYITRAIFHGQRRRRERYNAGTSGEAVVSLVLERR